MSLLSKVARGVNALSLAIIGELFKPPAAPEASTWEEFRDANPARFYRAKLQRIAGSERDSLRVDLGPKALIVTVCDLSYAIPLTGSDVALQAALDRFTLSLSDRGVKAAWFVIGDNTAWIMAAGDGK